VTSPSLQRNAESAPTLDSEHPWPGLEAFRERDAGFFRGRDAEIQRLHGRIRRARLTVLYGRSGLGKSSLLQAGAFPLLRRDRFLPVYVRLRFEDGAPPPMDQVVSALNASVTTAESTIEAAPAHSGDSLWEHLHRRESAYWSADNRPCKPTFIFDQFEEAFTLGRRSAQRATTEAFCGSLADLVEGRVPASLLQQFEVGKVKPTDFTLDRHRYQIVLSLREDFLADLKTLRPLMPSLLDNDMRLTPMSGIAGLSVTQAGGDALVPLEVGKLIVRLVADVGDTAPLEDLVVDPALLSLFLRGLNERRLRDDLAAIAPEWVRGGRDEILSRFYEDSVGDLGPAVRAFVEERLLTRSGYRNSFARDDALSEPGVTSEAIDTLQARRLVRLDEWAGRPRLELTHDVLTGVVRRSRDERTKREEAARKLAAADARAELERKEVERRRAEVELKARLDEEEVRRRHAEVEREQAEVRQREVEAELTSRRHEEEVRRIEQEDTAIRAERAEQRRLKDRARFALVLGWLAIALVASLVATAVFAVRASRQASRALEQARLAEARLQGLRQMVAAGDSVERQRILGRYDVAIRRLSPQDSIRARRIQAARAAVGDTLPNGSGPARARDSLGLKLWVNGSTLRVGFLGGSPDVQAKVRRYAPEWTRYANLRFVFCERCEAEIRVGFKDLGSWSYLGSDALGIPANEPTMNFGWLTSATPDDQARQVVLHEFGHVLGLFEEHLNPNAVIPWDTAAVYRYFSATQGWTRETIRNGILLPLAGVRTYRRFDPQSIMMFPIDSALTRGRLKVGTNTTLSASDKAFAALLYPRATTGGVPDSGVTVVRPVDASPTPGSARAHGPGTVTTEDRGMFGSRILDVAIGLALVYLLLSLVASAIREAFEGFVRSRAVELERGIRGLLGDMSGEGLARAFYEHPLISGLYQGPYWPAARRFFGRNLPTYIPAESFAVALLDMVVRGPTVAPYAAQQSTPILSVAGLRAGVVLLPSPPVQRAVLSAIDRAQGDLERAQANVEAWYNSAMDGVSGRYKRRAQFWLFVIGLTTTLALNVNTLTIADYLAGNEAARAAFVRRAQPVLRDTLYQPGTDTVAVARALRDGLQSLELPIGWNRRPLHGGSWLYELQQVAGLVLTAIAVMWGAPFSFDVLGKFAVVRSTVKPRERGSEEWEDGRTKGQGAEDRADTAERTGLPGNNVRLVAGSSETMSEAEPPHTDHRWSKGDPQEGIL
jgi:hypothetical protein